MARPADPHAREALVAAARAEFVRKGIRGARIEDITAACGLSKGAFYLHFSSKEDLFGQVVTVLKEGLERVRTERIGRMEHFLSEHGAIQGNDVAHHTERYESFVSMQMQDDLRTLEMMWSFRDVMDVLIRGSQGTVFESLVWTIVDRESERVAQDFQRLQGTHACRADANPELIGSLLIGTWMLLAKRMSRMEQKPDLGAWASSLHLLIREGIFPADARARAPRGRASATPRRAKPAPAPAPSPSPRRPKARAAHRTRHTSRNPS